MNKIAVKITQIDNVQNLHVVKFDFHGISLQMMSLDLNKEIEVGTNVHVGVKPTHLALAKEFSGQLSYSNQLQAKVIECENGKLLSAVELSCKGSVLESIITLSSSLKMNIQKGDEITILINASDIFIVDVIGEDAQ